ncbi:hypothetical protein [Loktanella sp. SALINAS62]|uniref:hypothetical protein n=1 Tax=Loktanella sp. SALINAS62 TaxID=2706124 RepID=UPI001B8B99D3|nr:hypothetical protein [Loktanella sp. SALINAS62]
MKLAMNSNHLSTVAGQFAGPDRDQVKRPDRHKGHDGREVQQRHACHHKCQQQQQRAQPDQPVFRFLRMGRRVLYVASRPQPMTIIISALAVPGRAAAHQLAPGTTAMIMKNPSGDQQRVEAKPR